MHNQTEYAMNKKYIVRLSDEERRQLTAHSLPCIGMHSLAQSAVLHLN